MKKGINTKNVWEIVKRLKAEGKLPEPTPEDIANEPTALANSGYRERAEREAMEREERRYPPFSPETSDSKPMGALRKEESKKALEELNRRALKEMKVQLSLDPEINWVVKTVDGKSYLSVKQN
jgi:hypothetical protein